MNVYSYLQHIKNNYNFQSVNLLRFVLDNYKDFDVISLSKQFKRVQPHINVPTLLSYPNNVYSIRNPSVYITTVLHRCIIISHGSGCN